MDVTVEKIAVVKFQVDPKTANKESGIWLKVTPSRNQLDLIRSCDRVEFVFSTMDLQEEFDNSTVGIGAGG